MIRRVVSYKGVYAEVQCTPTTKNVPGTLLSACKMGQHRTERCCQSSHPLLKDSQKLAASNETTVCQAQGDTSTSHYQPMPKKAKAWHHQTNIWMVKCGRCFIVCSGMFEKIKLPKQTFAQYQVSTQKHTGATTPHSVDIEAGNSKLFQHHFTRQLRIEPGRKHWD